MKTFIKITLAFSLLILGACSESPEKKIVGKWKDIEKPESKVEFYDDGTLVAFSESSPLRVKGKWSFLKDGRLKTEMSMMGIEAVDVFTVTFEGENMTTIDDKEDIQNFARDESL